MRLLLLLNSFNVLLSSFTSKAIFLSGVVLIALAYYKAKDDLLKKQKEQATLEYYESVETLLDSLYIDCGDTIFETDAGAKYLESKYMFDSLFINKQ